MRRDLEALATPVFGYKNHVNIDRTYDFIRSFDRSHASAICGHRLGRILDFQNTASVVRADAAYDACELRARLEARGIVPVIAHGPRGRDPARRQRGRTSRCAACDPGSSPSSGPCSAPAASPGRAARPVRPLTDVTPRPRLRPPPCDHARRCRMRIGGSVQRTANAENDPGSGTQTRWAALERPAKPSPRPYGHSRPLRKE